MNPIKRIIIVYDGECAICRRFRSFVDLRQKVTIIRYDMSTNLEIVAHYHNMWYTIDQGIIIDIDGVVYHAAMALTILDTLVAVPYWRQKVLLSHVRRAWIAKTIYPVLLFTRKILKWGY